ncbi:hypothetical protein [Glycomyces terrestris]|uniref:DUF4878 domain-containing protein n=1 Tax=Glycomyces terrestris TaxID=2493553 RepID=A0A426US80_9ACTN|nr:hypothetical protein [Glycomyces terrestris]RRR96388.1 hypothetical protein EIW28_21320 [Glycomyces terrestris]
MPADTAAQSSDAAEPVRTAEPPPAQVPRQEPALRRPAPSDPPPARDSGLLWSVVTAAAAVLFCAALVFGATRLFVGGTAADVTDTPERTVSAFLGALLDERDADAAAAWLCTDKADRDLSEAVAAMSAAEGDRGFEWGEVTETGRSVGAATVTAEIGIEGGASPATWEFTLVAEEGEPQWLICGIAAG